MEHTFTELFNNINDYTDMDTEFAIGYDEDQRPNDMDEEEWQDMEDEDYYAGITDGEMYLGKLLGRGKYKNFKYLKFDFDPYNEYRPTHYYLIQHHPTVRRTILRRKTTKRKSMKSRGTMKSRGSLKSRKMTSKEKLDEKLFFQENNSKFEKKGLYIFNFTNNLIIDKYKLNTKLHEYKDDGNYNNEMNPMK